MAIPEHEKIVLQGKDAIAQWQKANADKILNVSGADLRNAKLCGADLRNADLFNTDMRNLDLRNADLKDADLRNADLENANLTGANLIGINLHRTGLHRAKLAGTNLASTDLRHANLHRADLSRASLSRADLRGADLRNAILRSCDLSSANLGDANLLRAVLNNAILKSANLRAASLLETDLSGSDLSEADLLSANVSLSNLEGANVSNAKIGWSIFGDVDLSSVAGLQSVEHSGPSIVGVDTLHRSKGKIPDVFLRGCGFLDWEIIHARMYDDSLTPREISNLQIKVFDKRCHGSLSVGRVFISYSHANADFVNMVYLRLRKRKVRVWLDRHDMLAGSMQEQVNRAMQLNDIVLLVLSEHSTQSDWVENELDMARKKEKDEMRDVLCPVALDDSWKKKLDCSSASRALWRTLTDKLIVDFSEWKTEEFEKSFDRLYKGMKVNYQARN